MRKRIAVLLSALSMMMVMSVPPAMAYHQVGHVNNGKGIDFGNKANDGEDPNNGGGQEKAKNERPPHAGGDKHGGGSV